MDTIELPSRQSDQPITTGFLARLERFQPGVDADQEDLKRREQSGVFCPGLAQQDLINDQIVPCAAIAATAWRIPRNARWAAEPDRMTTEGCSPSRIVSNVTPSGCPILAAGSMSKNASIWTCRNTSRVIVWSAFAIELLPALPTPLRRTIRAVLCKLHLLIETTAARLSVD